MWIDPGATRRAVRDAVGGFRGALFDAVDRDAVAARARDDGVC